MASFRSTAKSPQTENLVTINRLRLRIRFSQYVIGSALGILGDTGVGCSVGGDTLPSESVEQLPQHRNKEWHCNMEGMICWLRYKTRIYPLVVIKNPTGFYEREGLLIPCVLNSIPLAFSFGKLFSIDQSS